MLRRKPTGVLSTVNARRGAPSGLSPLVRFLLERTRLSRAEMAERSGGAAAAAHRRERRSLRRPTMPAGDMVRIVSAADTSRFLRGDPSTLGTRRTNSP